ncbi:MAG: hypothetical protein JNM57_09180 [Cyclobacteriaceae bacterium]|nr:hypothetical protein [Cyclobacteriaceae bacterium]
MISTIPWFIGHTYAQPNVTPLNLMTATQWGGENGLVSNNITSAIQARSGFLWITTYNGLMRFDGHRLDVYDRRTIPFLSTDAFYQAYELADGSLWFAAQGSGIVHLDNGRFTSFPKQHPDALPKSIRCLYFDSDGTVWAGSNNVGLYSIRGNEVRAVGSTFLHDISIMDIVRDKNNILWIGTDGYGLFRYDGISFKQFTTYDGLSSDFVNALEISAEGELLIGTSNGLSILENGNIEPYDSLIGKHINAITVDVQGYAWIGTENGLARISKTKKYFEFASEENGFPYSRINGISFDREGSAWISTGRHGLIQLKETGIINYTATHGLSTNRTNIIVEGPGQTMFIGSDAGTLDIYKNGAIKSLPLKSSLNNNGIRDILIAHPDTVWIATYKGILRITPKEEKLFTKNDGLPADDMRRILKDTRGNLWLASRSGGVAKFRNNKVIEIYDRKNGLESNYILALEEDRTGKIYIGTHNGGLTIIEPDETLHTYHINKDDAGMLIFNIHIDDALRVWVVTNTGLFHFDGRTFIPIKLKKVFVGETYFDWTEDQYNNVWVTTNVGVMQLKKNEVLQFIQQTVPDVAVKLYDNHDGMVSKECTGATRSVVTSTGKIWIPTVGGVSIFDPSKMSINTLIPSVYITVLQTDSQQYSPDSVFEIRPGNLRFAFSFTALSLLSPDRVEFKYKLNDVDKFWVNAGKERSAEYTNLAPGTYTFQVIASNNDGLWNEQGASMTFRVLPHFYQTYWFFAVVVILILSTFFGIYKWRVHAIEKNNRELRKVNSELDRFVYSASHDLRAPLASILGLVSLARIDRAHDVESYLQKIEKSVQRLDGFVKDIVDFSRNARIEMTIQKIDFNLLIQEAIDNLKYLNDHNKIKIHLAMQGTQVFYTDPKRLSIILNNLIANAFKYYNPEIPNPYIKIGVVCEANKKCIITIADNGIGIGPEHIESIFKMFYRANEQSQGSGLGLYIVHETVEKLRGTIKVQSALGKGSTFTVTLPSLKF